MDKQEIKQQIAEIEKQLKLLQEALSTASKEKLVEILPGDFAFYSGYAYVIVENRGLYQTKDKYVGVRFGFKSYSTENQISWIELDSATWFAKHMYSADHVLIKPDMCNLSAVAGKTV